MTMKGPVPANIWGRMWAKAIAGQPTNGTYPAPINNSFKALLERDTREAVKDFVGDYVEPLFDEEHRLACQSLKDFYHALEELKTHDLRKLTDFRDGKFNTGDSEIAHLLTMTRPNRWTLTELVTGETCELTNDIVPGAGKSYLNREQWARVYAGGVLDNAYLDQLKRQPKLAVDNFPGSLPLPHQADDPILQLPTLQNLFDSPTLPLDLKNQTKLTAVLTAIANGISMEYDATLSVSLTC